MTELVLHKDRSNVLVELARSHVADGSISDPETPALLRRAAREQLDAAVGLRVVVVTALPVRAVPKDDFALVEYEVRPGVRNYHLARVPRNDRWLVRLGALDRALRRALRALARRLAGARCGPARIAPDPGTASPLRVVRGGRVTLLPGPSRC